MIWKTEEEDSLLPRLKTLKTHLLLNFVPHRLVRRLRIIFRDVSVLLKSFRQRILQGLLNASCRLEIMSGNRRNWSQLQCNEGRLMMIIVSLKKCVTALCSPPNVKSSIRDLSQISTTALIFMKTNYFRQDIWIKIWTQFHFQYIFEGRDDFIHTRHIIVPPQHTF